MRLFKRVTSLLIACVILLSTALVSSFYIVKADTVTTAYIEGTNVRVRTGPSLEDTIIETVSHISATVIDSAKDDENYTWYNITYYNGSQQITGYIRYDSSYIRIVTYNPDADFETKISAFPESYRDALRNLHAAYPNWEFTPDPVKLSFSEAVALQNIGMRKQVSFSSHPVSWRSMGLGAYDWSSNTWIVTNGGWTGASRETIAYYMDPRNFLNTSEIFMFLQQDFNSSVETDQGIKKIIAGTFMEKNISDPDDPYTEYSKMIMEAARQSNVSSYVLASKMRQEIGADGTSPLISGNTEHGKYFNFYNVGASGNNHNEVVANGLKRAKQEGWTTRSASIIGGAKFLANNYNAIGQDTYFYQDFNVHQPDRLWHQYAQAVHDARSKGVFLSQAYLSDSTANLKFLIPVYNSMPESVSPKPIQNGTVNNYYFENIQVNGLTPSFDKFTYNYDLYVNSDTTIYIKTFDNTTYVGSTTYAVKKGNNVVKLSIKSESGYVNDYVINVNAQSDCVIRVDSGTPPQTTVIRGDTNGDSQITLSDLANIRLHLLGLFNLTGDFAIGADTNKDGVITLSDLANVRLHLLGLFTIST